MEPIKSMFDYISGSGNYVVIPIMTTIMGLIVRLKLSKMLKAGATVGIGLIGFDMTLNLLWTYVGPVANIFMEKLNLNLNMVGIGWFAAAGLASFMTAGLFIIPFIILVSIILLMLKLTRITNIDIWNYWHYVFSGAVIYALTGNLIYAFVAPAVHCAIALTIADYMAKTVQDALGVPGISTPQGYTVTTVPIYKALDKVYDLALPKKVDKGADNSGLMNRLGFSKILAEPLFLRLIISILLGILVGYDLKNCLTVGMIMTALMHLLPRMIKVITKGLYPISEQTRESMQSRFHDEEFYIGTNSAILLGLPTTMSVALLLILIILALAMVLPINTTLSLGNLVSMAYFIPMATSIHKNSFGRTLINGTAMMGIVLCVAPFFAPMATQSAITGALAIPEGAVQVTVLSAGSLTGFILHQLPEFRPLGSAITVVLAGGIIYFFKKLAKRESQCYVDKGNLSSRETGHRHALLAGASG